MIDNLNTSPSDEAVALLQEYIRINTINPPGDVTPAANFLKDILEKEDIPVELYWPDKSTGRVNLLARLKGSGTKNPLLLLHHMDVVPVDERGWTVEPFGGVEKDGYLYGRGSLDMKNYGIVQLMSMLQLTRQGVDLDRDLLFLAVCDEEIGGELGAKWMVENHWDEMAPEFVLDEGGFGTEGFFTKDNRLIFSVGVAEKQMYALNLSIKRPPGHASMPPKENANFILSEALARVSAYTTPEYLTPVAKEMENRLGGLEQTVYNNAVRRNTISLTVLKGFVGDPPKTNVIPEHSEAVLDCRLLPEQDKDKFLEELKNVLDDDRITITPVLEPKLTSVVSSYDSDLFRIIEEETAKIYPDSITLPHLVIYGTDSRYFREKGASCYGFFPGPVSMEEYSRIHGNDERIRLDSLRKATDIYCSVVKQFCEKR